MNADQAGIGILIVAAGGSTRMRGRDKLLEIVRGRPLLADRAATALLARAAASETASADVYVALPPRDEAPGRWDALSSLPVHPVTVADHASGLSASLRAGVAALPSHCPGIMILPADMPDISAEDIGQLLGAFDGETILRGAASTGEPGHPVLFPRRDFAALAALTGDNGGRCLVATAQQRVRLLPLPGAHARTDLDTPEDWADWRLRQK